MGDSAGTSSEPLPYNELHMRRESACKNCGSDDLLSDGVTGDVVCRQCGTVAEPVIDSRSEWRNFANNDGGANDDPSRVGGPMTALMEGLGDGIRIGRREGGTALGKELARTHNKNNLTANQRTILGAYKDISNIMLRLQLPEIVTETAQSLFKKCEPKMRGRPTQAIIAACVFHACRKQNMSRTIKEIATITGVDLKDVSQCMKKIKALEPELVGSLPQQTAFLRRYCHTLQLDMSIEKAVRHVTEKCDELGLAMGKQPATVIGAAIYMVTQLTDNPKSLKDISMVVGLVEGTIRSAYKDMYVRRHELIPPTMTLARPVDHLPAA